MTQLPLLTTDPASASAVDETTAGEDGFVDLYQLHAREKLGLSAEWEAFRYEVLDDDEHVKISMGVPRLLKSGPRKGRKKWDRKQAKVAIFGCDDHKAWCEDWSKRTGRCLGCTGMGKTLKSCGPEGTKYNVCPKCKGTGKRQEGA